MELGLRQLVRLARRWWWILVLLPLAFATLATAFQRASNGGATYSASATLVINRTTGQSGSSFSPDTYATLLQTMPKPVLQAVVDEIGLPYDAETLKPRLGGYLSIDTEVLVVTARDSDAERAAEIANVFAREFAEHVGVQANAVGAPARGTLGDEIDAVGAELATLDDAIQSLAKQPDAETPTVQLELESLRNRRGDLLQSLRELEQQLRTLEVDGAAARSQLMVWESAEAPVVGDASGGPLILLVGAFAGLAIAGGIVFLFAYLDNTVKAGANFHALAGGPLLSEIAPVARLRQGPRQLFVIERPKSRAAEAIRLLRANVRFAGGDDLKSLAVTSPNPEEGRSTLTANLGVALAQAGLITVIIDADLRDPSQHRIFGVDNREGLTILLTRPDQSWRDVAIPTSIEGLSLIPAGPTAVNPADLLSRTRLSNLLVDIGEDVDVILVDTPAVLSVSDALVVGASVDGVILVCRAGRTRLDAMRRAAAALQQGGVRILGVVLNQRSASHEEGMSTSVPVIKPGGTLYPLSPRRTAPLRARPTTKAARRGGLAPPPSPGVATERQSSNGRAVGDAIEVGQRAP